MTEKPGRCKYIKPDGGQCKKPAKESTGYCWMHQEGKVNKKETAKMGSNKTGSKNPQFVHGYHSNTLKIMCNKRCFMYDECEFHTDDEEGQKLHNGICFFEIDTPETPDEVTLTQIDGIKKLTARLMKILEARINRGIRFELAMGGYLAEPEIVNMARTLSNLLFNMTNIYEKEELGDLKSELIRLQELYREAIVKMGGQTG